MPSLAFKNASKKFSDNATTPSRMGMDITTVSVKTTPQRAPQHVTNPPQPSPMTSNRDTQPNIKPVSSSSTNGKHSHDSSECTANSIETIFLLDISDENEDMAMEKDPNSLSASSWQSDKDNRNNERNMNDDASGDNRDTSSFSPSSEDQLLRCEGTVRRNEAVQHCQQNLQAVRTIQRWVRAVMIRHHHHEQQHNSWPKRQTTPLPLWAIVQVQARVRGFLARRVFDRLLDYVEQHVAALLIQKWWQQQQQRQRQLVSPWMAEHHEAATRIQALFRGWRMVEFYTLQRFAASLIQAQIRGRIGRKASQRQKQQARSHLQLQAQKLQQSQLPSRSSLQSDELQTSLDVARDFSHKDLEIPSSESPRRHLFGNDTVLIPSPPHLDNDMEEPTEPSRGIAMPGEIPVVSPSKKDISNARRTIEIVETEISRMGYDERPDWSYAPNELPANMSTTEAFAPGILQTFTPGRASPVQGKTIEFNTSSHHTVIHTPLEKSTWSRVEEKKLSESKQLFSEFGMEYGDPTTDVLPPSPAKTEVDMEDDHDDDAIAGTSWEEETVTESGVRSWIVTAFLIFLCFILPAILLSEQKAETSVIPKPSHVTIQIHSLNEMPLSVEPLSLQSKTEPSISPIDASTEKAGETMAMTTSSKTTTSKTNQPNLQPTLDNTSHLPPVATAASMEPAIRKPLKSESCIPTTTIHMPSYDAFQGMEIGEREKKLSKSVTQFSLPPVGKIANGIRERLFETSTVPPARVEITGWVEADGRGLFAKLLESEHLQKAIGRLRPPPMEDSSLNVAKNSDLSLLTEWGLTMTNQRRRR